MMDRKCKIVDGKVVSFRYVPDEAERKRKAFVKAMNRNGDWMPETSMKKILEAYNEAFEKYWEN